MRLWKIGLQSLAALVMALVGGTAHAQSSCLPRLAMGPQMPFPTIANRGTDDVVLSSTTWDPDGAGYQRERLVIGGVFTHAGGYTANRVAMWDGTTWQVVGPQGFNGAVNSLVVLNGTLYAGGSFTASGSTACSFTITSMSDSDARRRFSGEIARPAAGESSTRPSTKPIT